MAEINPTKWLQDSMAAAIKLLESRTRLATATQDVADAEAELQRLTGRNATIDLSSHSYTHHFECEGTPALAVVGDEHQEAGAGVFSIVPCRNVVEVWGHSSAEMKAPKICQSCLLEINSRKLKVVAAEIAAKTDKPAPIQLTNTERDAVERAARPVPPAEPEIDF